MNDLAQQEQAAKEKYQQALAYLKLLAQQCDFSPQGEQEFEAARVVCLATRLSYFDAQVKRFLVEEVE